MRPAIHRVDVVGKRIDLLVVTIVVLNGYFYCQNIALLFEIDRLVMENALVLIEVLNKFGDTAAIVELMRAFGIFPLVANGDANTFIKESFFPQSLGKFVEAEFSVIEDSSVRLESDLCSPFAGLAGGFVSIQLGDRNAFFILLLKSLAVAPDLQMQLLGKKINA